MPATYGGSSSYTPGNNEESVSYTYNERDLLAAITTETTTYTFTYDAFGNTTSVNTGNTEISSYEYEYTASLITKIAFADTNAVLSNKKDEEF